MEKLAGHACTWTTNSTNAAHWRSSTRSENANRWVEFFLLINQRWWWFFIPSLFNSHTNTDIDPSTQLQISTNSNDMMGPMASPSPNSSRNQFAAPASKNQRIIVGLPNAQNNPGAFQHPSMSRPVSVQIPRPGQIPQRMNQSPFSPQSQTPQSPHDQFPLSPAQTSIDPFSRPPSENSQQDPYLNVSCLLHIALL